MTKFRTGERVVDIETGIMGRVIATSTDPDIAEEVVAVRFDDDFCCVAFPVGDLRHASH